MNPLKNKIALKNPFKGRNVTRDDVLTWATVAVMTVFLLSVLIGAFFLNDKSLDFRNRQVLMVPTGSMDADPQPYHIETIPEGSLIMVRNFTIDDVREVSIGDVIAYEYGNVIIVHRVVDIDPLLQRLTLKGDANTSTETVYCDQVIGEVVGVSHPLGSAVDIVKGAPIIFLLLGLFCELTIVWAVVEIVRMYRESEPMDE